MSGTQSFDKEESGKEGALKEEGETTSLAEKGAAKESSSAKSDDPAPVDPTRYGDWEKNGRCIDF